jgi:hypothetical protein
MPISLLRRWFVSGQFGRCSPYEAEGAIAAGSGGYAGLSMAIIRMTPARRPQSDPRSCGRAICSADRPSPTRAGTRPTLFRRDSKPGRHYPGLYLGRPAFRKRDARPPFIASGSPAPRDSRSQKKSVSWATRGSLGMARYKFIERDFPHIVETLVSERGLGSKRDAMNDFHARHGIKAHLRHGRYKDGCRYIRWYFAHRQMAVKFRAKFVKERM